MRVLEAGSSQVMQEMSQLTFLQRSGDLLCVWGRASTWIPGALSTSWMASVFR